MIQKLIYVRFNQLPTFDVRKRNRKCNNVRFSNVGVGRGQNVVHHDGAGGSERGQDGIHGNGGHGSHDRPV